MSTAAPSPEPEHELELEPEPEHADAPAPAAQPEPSSVRPGHARGWARAGIVLGVLCVLAAVVGMVLAPLQGDLVRRSGSSALLDAILGFMVGLPALLLLVILGAVAVALFGRTSGRARRGAWLVLVAVAVGIPLRLTAFRGSQAIAFALADPTTGPGRWGISLPWMLGAGAIVPCAILAIIGAARARDGDAAPISEGGRPPRARAVITMVLGALLIVVALVEYGGNALVLHYSGRMAGSPGTWALLSLAYLAAQLPRALAEVGTLVALALLVARTASPSRSRTGARIALLALVLGMILADVLGTAGIYLTSHVLVTRDATPLVQYVVSGLLTLVPLVLAGLGVVLGGGLALRGPKRAD